MRAEDGIYRGGLQRYRCPGFEGQRRRASERLGFDDRRLEGRRHRVRQRYRQRAHRSRLCDALGRPVDGKERSQRRGSAVLNDLRDGDRRAPGAIACEADGGTRVALAARARSGLSGQRCR